MQDELFERLDSRLLVTEDTIVKALRAGAVGMPSMSGGPSPLAVNSIMLSQDVAKSKLKEPSVVAVPLDPNDPKRFRIVSRGTTEVDFELEDCYMQLSAERAGAQQERNNSSTFSKSGTFGYLASEPLNFVHRLVRNSWFEGLTAALIMSNAIFIGVQTDRSAASAGGPGDETWSDVAFVVNTVYTLLFLLELVLRIYCTGIKRFFKCRRGWHWHYLDVVVVVIACAETCFDVAERIHSAGMSRVSQGASQLRIMRILRTTRIIRGIRMTWVIRFVRSLRMLVHQIVSTARSLIWAVILLVMIIYLFAIVFTQGFTSLVDSGDEIEHIDALYVYWSSVPRSMFTLFKVITGGVSWEEVVHPLFDVGGAWVFLFIAYICFTQMAVLNVLTGAFCQNAIDSAQHDQDLVTQSILAQKRMYVRQIADIFADIDVDGSGTITIHEFRRHLKNESVQAVFDSLGIDASDVWTLFKLLDIDHDTVIELDEFVAGCLRLKGSAKALDMAKLCYENRSIAKRMTAFMKRTDALLDHVASRLGISGDDVD